MQLYQGRDIELSQDSEGVAWLDLGKTATAMTVLSDSVLQQLAAAIDCIEQQSGVTALVLHNSATPFCVGADVKGFLAKFDWPSEQLEHWCLQVHALFNRIEDLAYPTLSLVRGRVLGGGLELIMSTDFRIAEPATVLALPEVKLGIFPGWGGTVRLPRLIGLDNALEWIATGNDYSAEQALAFGLVDGLVLAEQHQTAAVQLLARIQAGDIDWQARRQLKTEPMPLAEAEAQLALSLVKGQILAKAGKHYPAPLAALQVIAQAFRLTRQAAQQIEVKAFVTEAKGSVAAALVSIFLNDTRLKGEAKQAAKAVSPASSLAVIGAGIMGAGIAAQAASKGLQAWLNDLSPKALDNALQGIQQQWLSRVEQGRLSNLQLAQALSRLSLETEVEPLAAADWVIEAVVEREDIKGPLLAKIDALQSEQSWLASNTSTLSIAQLATHLTKPERFCGLHFFNPVNKMPLLEIIRGPKTSDACILQARALASQLGKVPIVVEDCPGFYVNRVLFPYFRAFLQLLAEGVDYLRIDRVMMEYGWPMGPAWLLDVVGLDTANHAAGVLACAYPDRMSRLQPDLIEQAVQRHWLGQKTGQGFYLYQGLKAGRKPETANAELQALLSGAGGDSLSDEQIVQRLMLPLWFEVVRCIEQQIISDPAQIELGLIYGLGYPPFRGGPLQSMAEFGWSSLMDCAQSWQQLGAAYQVPARIELWAQRQWQPWSGAEL